MVYPIYEVIIQTSPAKFLKKLRDKKLHARLSAVIDGLESNPRPDGHKKLRGIDNAWRIRVGDYRIVYEIHDRQLVVLVIEIDHRKNIYR